MLWKRETDEKGFCLFLGKISKKENGKLCFGLASFYEDY